MDENKWKKKKEWGMWVEEGGGGEEPEESHCTLLEHEECLQEVQS